ncbi:MAG: glycerol-3-phosphate 1-O-acyltransferase PlsY [Christensenellales bacterium]|jgi:glycerol-3-phosphate acyltransferase PlsY
MTILAYIASSVLAYLLGSISPGIIISHHFGTDIRSQGSKSTGATNMTRVMGLRLGLITFLSDFFKASLAVLISHVLAGEPGMLLAGLFVVIGHNWPVFYQFKGGKGVACSLAVLFWSCPVQTLIAGALAILVIAMTRYVSLGSLTLLAMTFLLILFTKGLWPVGVWALVLLALGVYQHRTNIKRLINGNENKLNPRSSKK